MAPLTSCTVFSDRFANERSHWVDISFSVRCGMVQGGNCKLPRCLKFLETVVNLATVSICRGEATFYQLIAGKRGRIEKWYRLDSDPIRNHGGQRPTAHCSQCGRMFAITDGMIAEVRKIASASLEVEGYTHTQDSRESRLGRARR